MLFLLRPRQTWMPFTLERDPVQQAEYNAQLEQAYADTRRVPPAVPAPAAPRVDPLAQLKELASLYASGALTDAELAQAKALILATDTP